MWRGWAEAAFLVFVLERFDLTVVIDGQRATIALAGPVARSGVMRLATAFNRALDQGAITVVVDLGGVTFLAEEAVEFLVRNSPEVTGRSFQLRVVNATEAARQALRSVHVPRLLKAAASDRGRAGQSPSI